MVATGQCCRDVEVLFLHYLRWHNPSAPQTPDVLNSEAEALRWTDMTAGPNISPRNRNPPIVREWQRRRQDSHVLGGRLCHLRMRGMVLVGNQLQVRAGRYGLQHEWRHSDHHNRYRSRVAIYLLKECVSKNQASRTNMAPRHRAGRSRDKGDSRPEPD